VDAASERAIDALLLLVAARTSQEYDALKARAIIAFRNAIFEAIKG
jgi:hypothetical protein